MDLDIVVIGLNASATLKESIESALSARYNGGDRTVFYVDCGSDDDSMAIAESIPGVIVLEALSERPTAARARNVGWRAGSAPVVMFLDSDSLIDPEWLESGVQTFEEANVGAADGELIERFPDATIYNWWASQDWKRPVGEGSSFGGMVMVRREALEQTNGYIDELAVGEDPELGNRVRRAGWRIVHRAEPMVYHDIGMSSWQQYVRRTYRNGYSYGACAYQEAGGWSGLLSKQMIKLTMKGGGALLLFLLGLFSLQGWPIVIGLLLLFFPRLFRVGSIARELNLSRSDAKLYAWNCCFVTLPQFLGAIRYFFGELFGRPLVNRKRAIRTRSSQPA